MKKPKFFLCLGIAVFGVVVISILSNKKSGEVKGLISPLEGVTPAEMQIVLTPSATPSIEPVATPSAIPTATPSATPTRAKPKAVLTPTATLSLEVNGFIDRFAAQYGVDPNVVRYVALCESGFRSNAVNGPYVGLFQFGEITWKNIREEIGEDANINLRYSAEESVQTAAYALSKGKSKIWPNCIP